MMGGGAKPGGRSQDRVGAQAFPSLLGPVRGPGSWFGSVRPAPVSEVTTSFRGTTSFVMGGGGPEAQCPVAAARSPESKPATALAKWATSAHVRKEWSIGGRKRAKNRCAPRSCGVDLVLGDEKKPRKKASRGREMGRERPVHYAAKRLWIIIFRRG